MSKAEFEALFIQRRCVVATTKACLYIAFVHIKLSSLNQQKRPWHEGDIHQSIHQCKHVPAYCLYLFVCNYNVLCLKFWPTMQCGK